MAWPEGSAARASLLSSLGWLLSKQQVRVVEMEGWLDQEWRWLDDHEDDRRYGEREKRWLGALGRYVAAVDDLSSGS